MKLLVVGIRSYGAYIPWYRISRSIIYSAIGFLEKTSTLPGEKSVANYDEDVVTMGVAACMDCLRGVDRHSIDALYFAITTPIFEQRQNAGIVATALNLRSNIQTADFTGSLKAGTTALISAYNLVKAGEVENVLVCASGCCTGKAGGPHEAIYGDGAAAFIVGKNNIVATIDGSYSISYDFVDHWRERGEKYDQGWEDRWIRECGYSKFVVEAISGLAKKYGIKLEDLSKIVYPPIDLRTHYGVGRLLGLKTEQIQDHMLDRVGNTNVAHPLIMLVATLENLKPDERIIVAGYGSGSDALLLRTTPEVEQIKDKRRGVKKHLSSKSNLNSYEKYVVLRNMLEVEVGRRGEETPLISYSVMWRRRKTILGFCGSRCKRCGTPQFPPQIVCVNPDCKTVGEMEDYCFSDKVGRVLTFTEDHLAYSPIPPNIYGVIDFDEGGRHVLEITDCEVNTVKVGIPVEMTFRRKYLGKVYNYFWKATPRKFE